MTNETTASQPKSIGDDAQFQALVWDIAKLDEHRWTRDRIAALVAYIDNFRAPAAQASATIQAAPGFSTAALIVRDVCELDYSGEEDFTPVISVNVDDLRVILDRHLAATIQAAPIGWTAKRVDEAGYGNILYSDRSSAEIAISHNGPAAPKYEIVPVFAATIQEPVLVAEPVSAAQTITINGRQLQDALDAAWPDREDVEQGDTELTMFVRHEDGVDSEGNAQPRGLWFYWTEYPEEGVSWLNPESEMPPLAQFADSTTRAAPMVADPAGVAAVKTIIETLQLVFGKIDPKLSSDQFRPILKEVQAAIALAATVKAVPSEALTRAASYVLLERARQVDTEGWTTVQDDGYKFGELAKAAICYVRGNRYVGSIDAPIDTWPFDHGWWKPTTHRRNLTKAAALILAEIERIDRARASAETGGVKS